MERVLVVDDDVNSREMLAETLETKGFAAVTAENGRKALRLVESGPTEYGLIFSDVQMPEVGGIELVEHVNAINPTIVNVLLTGFVNRSTMLGALRAGAYDFLSKPYTLMELEMSLARAIERRKMLQQNEQYRATLEKMLQDRDLEIAGTNRMLQELYSLGSQSYLMVDLSPELNDFTRYATKHFNPDTFGIFVDDGRSTTELAYFDRAQRPFQEHGQVGFRFSLRNESFGGYIYLGFDRDPGQSFQNQKHVFGLFRDRVESYLREHYTAHQHQEQLRKMFVSSIQAHARSIEAKDAYTAGHCDRVDRYAELLARRCGGFDETWIFNLKVASILHDIGKIGVRSAILCKPSALDDVEAQEIQTHPVIGGRIVRTLHGFNLEPAVRHHHERFDGKGYPSKLKGEAIPLESRMILIADTFDAMTSDRPYRRALRTEQALDELQRFAGTQFDPDLVKVMVAAGGDLESARGEMEKKPRGDYFAC
jgi:response regulator RpfG family c-di-GMP phosphodiesterase